jgi:hypothetical protein
MLIIPPIPTYNHKTIGQYEIIVSEKLFKMPLLGPIKRNHFLFQALLEIIILCIFTLQSKLHLKVLCNVYKSSFFGFCFCIL